MITYGIDNISFDIKDNLVYTDHKCLELIYLEDENRKLNRIKEMIEPYIRVYKKSDEIKNKLIEVFKSDMPEIKLLRLIHDNKNKYKAIKKKFKFRTNLIKDIIKNVKELQKKEDKIIINTKNEDNILDDRKRKIIGIITLEDLLEAILKIHFKEERESTRITII